MFFFQARQQVLAVHAWIAAGDHPAVGICNHRCTDTGRVDHGAQDRHQVPGLALGQRVLALQRQQVHLRLQPQASPLMNL